MFILAKLIRMPCGSLRLVNRFHVLRVHPLAVDLQLRERSVTFRMPTTGALYAWELERGRRSWRVPVRSGLVTNDPMLSIAMAEQGMGLAYAFEPNVATQIRAGRLKTVLDAYAPTVPGHFLAFPSRAQSSPALRLFIDVAKELLSPSRPAGRRRT